MVQVQQKSLGSPTSKSDRRGQKELRMVFFSLLRKRVGAPKMSCSLGKSTGDRRGDAYPSDKPCGGT